MVQGVRTGSGFFFGSGIYSSIDPTADINQSTGLPTEDKPFGAPATNLRETGGGPTQSSSQNQQQVPMQLRLGEQSLQEFARQQQSRFRRGGNRLAINEGALTFTSGENSLTLEAGTNARFYRADNDEITLQNRETGEELTLQAGDNLQVSGEGQADFGVLSPFSLAGGDEATIEQTDGGPVIHTPESNQNQEVTSLQEPPEAGRLQMEVFQDPESQRLQALNYQLLQKPAQEARNRQKAEQEAEAEETEEPENPEEEEEEPPTIGELMAERNPEPAAETENTPTTDDEPPTAETTEETEVISTLEAEETEPSPLENISEETEFEINQELDRSEENASIFTEQNSSQLEQIYFSENEEELSGNSINTFA
ncbi:MAG: hypothetical protein ACQEP7_04290 [bacterium]